MLSTLARADFAPKSNNLVCSLFSLRKLKENHGFILAKQLVREEGWEWRFGFAGDVELGVNLVAVEMDVEFTENVTEQPLRGHRWRYAECYYNCLG